MTVCEIVVDLVEECVEDGGSSEKREAVEDDVVIGISIDIDIGIGIGIIIDIGIDIGIDIRAGNMGRAQWAGPNWPDILKGWAVKLAARIKSGPIGPARIGQPIRVRAGLARLAINFF